MFSRLRPARQFFRRKDLKQSTSSAVVSPRNVLCYCDNGPGLARNLVLL
jgi:hypothetical protein